MPNLINEVRMHEKIRQYNKIRRGTTGYSCDIIIEEDDVTIAIHHYIREDGEVMLTDMCLLGYDRDWSDEIKDPIDGKLRGVVLIDNYTESIFGQWDSSGISKDWDYMPCRRCDFLYDSDKCAANAFRCCPVVGGKTPK